MINLEVFGCKIIGHFRFLQDDILILQERPGLHSVEDLFLNSNFIMKNAHRESVDKKLFEGSIYISQCK